MNKLQRNHLAMFNAVQNVFTTYQAELTTVSALAEKTTVFAQLLTEIEKVRQIQSGQITGTTQLKIKEEQEMIAATLQVAGAIYVYAQEQHMSDLQAKVLLSPSNLTKMADDELKVTCLNVYAEAEKLNGNLTDFGISPEFIANLKKEIDDFAALIASPRSAIVTRSQATRQLKELIEEANQLLRNQVDKLMLLVQPTQPTVYNTYKAARIIVNLGNAKPKEQED